MTTYWKRFAARRVALATCVLLPTLCGCVATPPNLHDGWVFETPESPTPKPSEPAAAPRSQSSGDSAQNSVQQVGSADPLPIFSGRAQRSEAVR
jgi:hypothetical protein